MRMLGIHSLKNKTNKITISKKEINDFCNKHDLLKELCELAEQIEEKMKNECLVL